MKTPRFANPVPIDETPVSNPRHIWVEPTTRCNTRCLHCEHYYSSFGEDMPRETAHKIFDSLLDNVAEVELIGYGEPFIAKHFDEMFDRCAERGVGILITSNGLLVNDERRVQKLVEAGVDLCLSIDGARAETFEFVRPYMKWERILESLECVARCARRAGKDGPFVLRFNFVPMKNNVADLPDLVRLAAKYGAQTIRLLPLTGSEFHDPLAGQSLQDCPDLVSKPFLEALELGTRLGVEIPIPLAFLDPILNGVERGKGLRGKTMRGIRAARIALIYARAKGLRGLARALLRVLRPTANAARTRCRMPWNDTYFAADGTVHPCCLRGEENLGDIVTHEWREIWHGPLYRNLRRTIHSWNPTALCRYCPLPEGINGGDRNQYEKFFSRYEQKAVALDSERVSFGEGFYELERLPDGRPSHRWMGRKGTLELPSVAGARFLRFHVIPRAPVRRQNPGRCRIDGGAWEPFDNTCLEITFPVRGRRGDFLRVEIEMEDTFRVGEDPRDLGLAIHRVCFLCRKSTLSQVSRNG